MLKNLADKKNVLIITALFLILICTPYIFAYYSGGDAKVFGGFLLNPVDGNTYLAKMYQGWQGQFSFTLPYTANSGTGSYIFLYYLLLGHISRILHLPTIFVFHISRILGALFLAWGIRKYIVGEFAIQYLKDIMLAVLLIGLGSGWLLIFANIIPTDLWVAEGFPFLSAYMNPHFPFALGLIVLLIYRKNQLDFVSIACCIIVSILLAVILPFGIVIVLIIRAFDFLWLFYTRKTKQEFFNLIINSIVILFSSGPILIYYLYITKTHVQLSGWNTQNLTPSPPMWDLLISLFPAIAFAGLSLGLLKQENSRLTIQSIFWLLSSIILMYLPFGLQRRMITGIYIPVVILAFTSIGYYFSQNNQIRFSKILFIFSLPSTFLIILFAYIGSIQRAPELYLWTDELRAFQWIEENTNKETLILSAPDTGLFIPAHTGRKVLYGHPFETVNAEYMEKLVIDIFNELKVGNIDVLPDSVQYIFIGPRENEQFTPIRPLPLKIVYHNDLVTIYQND